MPDKNTELWDSVCETDPNYTTTVNQRGGFTAIGAQYQVKCATEKFGPYGLGFGVRNETFKFVMEDRMVVYQAQLYYKLKGEEGTLPIHSSATTSYGSRIDDDCIKKVATDAFTKGLSKLGFNADVFMGKFDDNKYVSTLESKYGVSNARKITTKGKNSTPSSSPSLDI